MGNIMGISWVYHGYIMGISWVISWVYHGYIMGISWVFVGRSHFYECIMGISWISCVPSGKHLQKANWKMAIEIVDLPMKNCDCP